MIECKVNVSMDISHMIAREGKKSKYVILDDASIKLRINSTDCGFELEATLIKDPRVSKLH